MGSITKQSGALWVEFLVSMSFVLVSLFSLVPLLGKYIDVRHRTEQAARYGSWERTVWQNTADKSADKIRQEAETRIISSGDNFLKLQNRASGQYVDLLNETSGQALQFTEPKSGKHPMKSGGSYPSSVSIGATVTRDYFTIPLFGINRIESLTNFDVNENGYFTNTVSTSAKLPTWLDGFDGVLSFSSHGAIAVDGWGAGGKSYNRNKVKDFTPPGSNAYYSELDAAKGFYEVADTALSVVNVLNVPLLFEFDYDGFMESSFDNIEYEKVDTEQLLHGEGVHNTGNPEGRLGVY